MSGKPPLPLGAKFKALNSQRLKLTKERAKYYNAPESQIVEATEKIRALDSQIAKVTKNAKEVLAKKEKEKKELDKVRDIIHTEGIVAAKTRRQGGTHGKTRRTRVKNHRGI